MIEIRASDLQGPDGTESVAAAEEVLASGDVLQPDALS
jgi:hypothetical protein